jgi:3-deoxy-7-phosphoheptulonate synthase
MLDSGMTRTRDNGVSNVTSSGAKLTDKRGESTVVWVGEVPIGGLDAVVMAGPCSVEGREQVTQTALAVKERGAVILRGGAYKPRTSPYDFQGLGTEGLRLLREAGDIAGMPVVTEVMSEDDVAVVRDHADMIQVGARNMQNFALLRKLSKIDTPVLLKRGPSATVKEWLSAAEYLLHGGNENVVLCERGIKTFDSSLRNTMDLAAVALVKEMTHLPVIVDPSHATGKRSIVGICARAAIAIGADGVIVEVHPDPDNAWSDGAQSLTFEKFSEMMEGLDRPLRALVRESALAY